MCALLGFRGCGPVALEGGLAGCRRAHEFSSLPRSSSSSNQVKLFLCSLLCYKLYKQTLQMAAVPFFPSSCIKKCNNIMHQSPHGFGKSVILVADYLLRLLATLSSLPALQFPSDSEGIADFAIPKNNPPQQWGLVWGWSRW